VSLHLVTAFDPASVFLLLVFLVLLVFGALVALGAIGARSGTGSGDEPGSRAERRRPRHLTVSSETTESTSDPAEPR
jgi:hypothetical protein